jgi:aspartyl aminopeptidase
MSDSANDLLSFIDRSPSPYHAVAEGVRRLEAAGFRAASETEVWELNPGDRLYVVRNEGSLAALQIGEVTPVSRRTATASSPSSPMARCCCTPGWIGISLSRAG